MFWSQHQQRPTIHHCIPTTPSPTNHMRPFLPYDLPIHHCPVQKVITSFPLVPGTAQLPSPSPLSPGVSQNQQAGLLELLLHLVGEGTGGVATRQGLGTNVLRKLVHSTLAVGASGLHHHIL